jgi:hypothetical protein
MYDLARTNGFRIRCFNQDCDRLAVQSSLQATWWCRYHAGLMRRMLPVYHVVGIAQSELIVLRPYRGTPEFELEALGGPYGVLIAQRANGGTTVLRNYQRQVFHLDAALVLKTEHFQAPRHEGHHGAV